MSIDNITKLKKNFERLVEALDAAGIKKYGRNRKVAKLTGYSEARVSEMLSGKLPLNSKFKTIVCSKFAISEIYVNEGTGDPLVGIPDKAQAVKEISPLYLRLSREKKWLFELIEEMDDDEAFDVVQLIRKHRREKELRG